MCKLCNMVYSPALPHGLLVPHAHMWGGYGRCCCCCCCCSDVEARLVALAAAACMSIDATGHSPAVGHGLLRAAVILGSGRLDVLQWLRAQHRRSWAVARHNAHTEHLGHLPAVAHRLLLTPRTHVGPHVLLLHGWGLTRRFASCMGSCKK